MPAPTPLSANPTVAERLTAAQSKMQTVAGNRRWYRFRIQLRPDDTRPAPLPFSEITIGTKATPMAPSKPFTFQDFTNPLVPDERNPNRFERGRRKGTWAQATPDEIGALKTRIDDFVVRWKVCKSETAKDGTVSLAYAADLLDTTIESNMAGLNPETDEPVGKYLVIEGPFSGVDEAV